MIKLTELFSARRTEEMPESVETLDPEQALITSFGILTRGNGYVISNIAECLADTEKFYSAHEDILTRREMKYSPEVKPWLCVIAAVEASAEKGFMREIGVDCTADEFGDALKTVLEAAGIRFSDSVLVPDRQKSLTAWVRQFNQYAGQFGVTLYFVDLYGENLAMGAAGMSDYAEAAEIAGFAGVRVTCRPE